MKYGILGSGAVARSIQTKLEELGHEVMTSHRDEYFAAARYGERIFNCVKGTAAIEAIESAGKENLSGKILIDLSNPFIYDGRDISLDSRWHGTTSLGEEIQRRVPDTKVVKTLNYIHNNLMTNPDELPESPTAFYCGNDNDSKQQVRLLLESFGWLDTFDLGDISAARYTEMLGAFWPPVFRSTGNMRWGFKLIR